MNIHWTNKEDPNVFEYRCLFLLKRLVRGEGEWVMVNKYWEDELKELSSRGFLEISGMYVDARAKVRLTARGIEEVNGELALEALSQ
jgi:hypothetical protein